MTANVAKYSASAPWEVRSEVCVRLVKGTNELFEADGSGGPDTKCVALFDPRPWFDG